MASKPSIKGTVFEKAAEDIGKLLGGGELSRAQAERWLEPDDFALMERKIVVSGWYDIRAYGRMCRLLLEVVGHGDVEYLRERGRETFRRMQAAGLYSQVEYVQRTEVARVQSPSERFAAFGRDLRILITMGAQIVNFSKWTGHPDPDHPQRYLVEMTEARDYPDECCWTTEGFMNEMTNQYEGAGDVWRWQRTAPDRVVYRMGRDL